MNQLNKGTFLVVIATTIVSVLILMTDRGMSLVNPKTNANNHSNPEKDLIKNNVQETTFKEVLIEEDQQPANLIDTSQQVDAPKGPFKHSLNDSIDVAELKVETIAPTTLVATSTQHELLNHIIEPIWMDQKLGEFKKLEKGGLDLKLMPTNPGGLQGEDPKQVITTKNDRFIPASVTGNYNYQQMPMFNGGYYIAPMPSFLMSSTLPKSAVIDNKK